MRFGVSWDVWCRDFETWIGIFRGGRVWVWFFGRGFWEGNGVGLGVGREGRGGEEGSGGLRGMGMGIGV